jgi:hypothetical protein
MMAIITYSGRKPLSVPITSQLRRKKGLKHLPA